jgi:hypothetical protein
VRSELFDASVIGLGLTALAGGALALLHQLRRRLYRGVHREDQP